MPAAQQNENSVAIANVLRKLDWMREQRIWPNGTRYLWTDSFGVVLLVSLYRELEDYKFLDDAERVVEEYWPSRSAASPIRRPCGLPRTRSTTVPRRSTA